MLKYLGAVLVVAACALWGIGKVRALRKRRDDLLCVIDALRYINAELSYKASPLEEILSAVPGCSLFNRLSEKLSAEGFENAETVWNREICGDRTLSLSREQRRELARVGMTLGRYPAAEQLSALGCCMERLEYQAARAGQNAAKGAKLYMGLALSLGLMTAAVLL